MKSTLIALCATLAVAGCGKSRVELAAMARAQAAAQAQAQARIDAALIAEAEHNAAYDLNDPESAHFREATIHKSVAKDGHPIIAICGQINGKNRFGAYTGYVPFFSVAHSKLAAISPGDGPTSEEIQAANARCYKSMDYSNDSLDTPACDEAHNNVTTLLANRKFENAWEQFCGNLRPQ